MSQTDGNAIRAALAGGTGKVSFSKFASTKTLGDEVNSSSSRGPSTPNFDIKPDVSAPGTNIMSTIPMYKKISLMQIMGKLMVVKQEHLWQHRILQVLLH